jgi:BolA protein
MGHKAYPLQRIRNEGFLMSVEARIRLALMDALQPARLDVTNESALHAGHGGSPGTGESHFRVLIVSERFEGKTRIERHRMVNEALAAELRDGLHALAIKALTPREEVR